MPVKRNLLIRKKKEISLLLLIVFLALLIVFQISSFLTPKAVEKIKPFTIPILFWILIGTMGIILLSITYFLWQKRKKIIQKLNTFQLLDFSTGNPVTNYGGDISLWTPTDDKLNKESIILTIAELENDIEIYNLKIEKHTLNKRNTEKRIKELKERGKELDEKMEKKEVKDKSERMDCPECGQLNTEFSDEFNKIVKCVKCGIYFNAMR